MGRRRVLARGKGGLPLLIGDADGLLVAQDAPGDVVLGISRIDAARELRVALGVGDADGLAYRDDAPVGVDLGRRRVLGQGGGGSALAVSVNKSLLGGQGGPG